MLESAARHSSRLYALALAFTLNACGGAPLPPQRSGTAPVPEASAPTIPDLIVACQALQSQGVIGCRMARGAGSTLAMILHFETERELKAYAEPVTKMYTLPFCRAANRALRPARFYFELHGQGANYLDCEFGQWGDAQAIRRPAAAATAAWTGNPVQECAAFDADNQVPGRCAIAEEGGLYTLTVSFRSQAEGAPFLDQVDHRIAAPFCEVVNGQGSSSFFRVLYVAEKRGRAFNCATRQWGQWFSLQAPPSSPHGMSAARAVSL